MRRWAEWIEAWVPIVPSSVSRLFENDPRALQAFFFYPPLAGSHEHGEERRYMIMTRPTEPTRTNCVGLSRFPKQRFVLLECDSSTLNIIHRQAKQRLSPVTDWAASATASRLTILRNCNNTYFKLATMRCCSPSAICWQHWINHHHDQSAPHPRAATTSLHLDNVAFPQINLTRVLPNNVHICFWMESYHEKPKNSWGFPSIFRSVCQFVIFLHTLGLCVSLKMTRFDQDDVTAIVFNSFLCFGELVKHQDVGAFSKKHLHQGAPKNFRVEPEPHLLWCHFESR